MARVAIPVNEISAGEGLEVTTVAIDATNDHSLTADGADDMIIGIVSTTGSSKTVTFNAGDSEGALRAGIGSLIVTVQANESRYVRLETSRHLNADGTISVDAEASLVGTIFALKMV